MYQDLITFTKSKSFQGILIGIVISIVTLGTFVVAGPDNVEKTIRVSDETLFREFREELSSEDIVIGSFVVVLGSPNEGGEIEATLVRFLPPPPDFISNDRSE